MAESMNNSANTVKKEGSLEEVHKISLRILSPLVFALVVLYLASFPSYLAIFLIEYLKLPPQLCLDIIKLALPTLTALVLADLIARLFSITYLKIFKRTAPFLLLPILLIALIVLYPLLLLAKRMFSKSPRYTSLLDGAMGCLENWKKKSRKDVKSEYGLKKNRYQYIFFYLFIIFMSSFLYLSCTDNSSMPRRWNYKNNSHLEAVANTHYYCQIQPNYRKKECVYWTTVLNKISENAVENKK